MSVAPGQPGPVSKARAAIASHWPVAAGLLAVGLYLQLWVDARLLFWNQNDLFLWDRRFLATFLVEPGLPAQWAGKLLLQACSFGWPGAAALAALTAAVLLTGQAVVARVAGPSRWAWLIPAAAMAFLYGQYLFSPASPIGLALALAACLLYVRLSRNAWAAAAAFLVLSAAVYYLAGQAYYVMAACCLACELLRARRLLPGLAIVAIAAAVPPALARGLALANDAWLHVEPAVESFLLDPPTDRRIVTVATVLLYAAFPLTAAALGVRARWWPRTAGPVSPSWQRSLAAILATAAVTGGAVGVSAAGLIRRVLLVDYSSARGDWKTVLAEAPRLPPKLYAQFANQDVNLALYHTGRLPWDMFAYPQLQVFTNDPYGGQGRLLARKSFDLQFQLGRINEAEQIAHNCLEERLSAEFLQRLARVKLVKGQAPAASLYLNVLADDLVYGRWARDALRRLRADPALRDDAELEAVRALIIRDDDAGRSHVAGPGKLVAVMAQEQLQSLLARNPRNRMASEFLMLAFLVRGDVDSLAARLVDLKDLAYPRLPSLYEEAAVLYAQSHPEALAASPAGPTLAGWPISQACLDRHRAVCDALARGPELPPDLRTGYFFYYLANRNPQ